jgi:hypothetical protein
MSTANAAAIRRRTGGADNNKPSPQFQATQQQQQQQQQPNTGLTLPQIISVVDKRLLVLETFMKETKEVNKTSQSPSVFVNSNNSSPESEGVSDEGVPKEVFNNIISEYNQRFEILAVEINNIKDVILKLQSFTMDVNKMLVEERINILTNTGATLTISDPTSENQSEDEVINDVVNDENTL